MRLMVMPRLTASLGPAFAPHDGKYAKLLTRQHRLMEELIERLPAFDYFQQNFHHSLTNWLPFHWTGFTQTTRYTYVLDDLTDLDRVWAGTRDSVRRSIRKARKQVTVRDDLALDTFVELNRKTFARQEMSLPYSPEFVSRIDRACAERNCRRIFFAEDEGGRVHAALYLVWDRHAAFYLMGGSDPASLESVRTKSSLEVSMQGQKITLAQSSLVVFPDRLYVTVQTPVGVQEQLLPRPH